MQNRIAVIMATALVAIAGNLTYSNLSAKNEIVEPEIKEEVVEVLGKAWITFDGLGATVGLIVRDQAGLRLVRLDNGSAAANEVVPPKYLSMITWTNGDTSYSPLFLEPVQQ